MPPGRKILITGGAGFIGANLLRANPRGEDEIVVLDNLATGRAEDVASLPVRLIVGDIRDQKLVPEVMAGAEVVIALAAHTGVVASVADPDYDFAVNVEGTLNLLKAAVQHRVKRFLFASTGGAIVGPSEPPVQEDMPPRPLSPYGASKLAGEGYCSAFYGSYGLKTVILRFSNVYGPYSYHKGSVIAKFFRQIHKGEELVIYGDGEQTRDFLYVEDLCQALWRAVEAEVPFGQPIQLGTGRETSINSLVTLMRQVVGERNFPPVRYAPPRRGEVRRNFVSIERARRYLDFHPKTDLVTGLERTWEWFRSGAPSGER